MYVKLTNGVVYGCDIIVSATGVIPNTSVFQVSPSLATLVAKGSCNLPQVELAFDGGIAVDHEMRSSCEQVYAAGDACTVQWKDPALHWFQVTFFCQCVVGVVI